METPSLKFYDILARNMMIRHGNFQNESLEPRGKSLLRYLSKSLLEIGNLVRQMFK